MRIPSPSRPAFANTRPRSLPIASGLALFFGAFGCASGPSCPVTPDDLASPPPDADMTPGPDCKAAAGLKGKRLLCIDFDTAPAAELQKWSFAVGTTCGGRSWEVGTLAMPESKDRALQLQNFATYSGASCGFQAPALDLSQYPSVTLSIEHWVDLATNTSTKAMQLAEIWAVPSLMPPRVSLYQGQDLAWRQFTVRIRRQELTNTPTFQPHFNLSSPGMFGDTYAGWRIRSIAVLGE